MNRLMMKKCMVVERKVDILCLFTAFANYLLIYDYHGTPGFTARLGRISSLLPESYIMDTVKDSQSNKPIQIFRSTSNS